MAVPGERRACGFCRSWPIGRSFGRAKSVTDDGYFARLIGMGHNLPSRAFLDRCNVRVQLWLGTKKLLVARLLLAKVQAKLSHARLPLP
jgi:hypothetical protein